jgi:hypothetical protein
MSGELEPVSRPDAGADALTASGAAPGPGPTQTPEPDKNPDREREATTRSARYALVAAVSAAIISSLVSAGAAVYVSINQANRGDRQAVTNAVRADREKNYTDYSGSLFNYVDQLGLFRASLAAHQPVDFVRSKFTELARGHLEWIQAEHLLIMAGSPGMRDYAMRMLQTSLSFWKDHLVPFEIRYLQLPNAPDANDSVGWEKDSAALGSAIDDLLNKIGDLDGAFLDQGIKDLQ